MIKDSPLGKASDYSDKYAPGLLYVIERAESRGGLAIDSGQAFAGVDIWHAWELTWLDAGGKPQAATAELRVPCDSPRLVESKSLKLYLNSFAMTRLASVRKVEGLIERDLSAATGAQVVVHVTPVGRSEARLPARLPGTCIDTLDVDCDTWQVDPGYLRADASCIVREDLYSHLLRSLCPVTGQPDSGSLLISYRGPRIDRAGLLKYVVSYRQHSDFHEACVERIFCDISAQCGIRQLSVCAYYQRRGGIDINPFRSNFEAPPRSLRLWRQ